MSFFEFYAIVPTFLPSQTVGEVRSWLKAYAIFRGKIPMLYRGRVLLYEP